MAMSDIDFCNSEVWMHRNNHCGDLAWNVLLDQLPKDLGKKTKCKWDNDNLYGYISIGSGSSRYEYEKYSEIIKENGNRSLHNSFFHTAFPELDNGKNPPRWWNYLYNFMYSMNNGDYILVPSRGEYYVFQIVSNVLFYDKDEELRKVIKKYEEIEQQGEFSLFRKVKLIFGPCPRKTMSTGSLTRVMKYQGTNCKLNEDAKKCLGEYYREGKQITFVDRVKEEVTPILIEQLYSSLTSDTFEALIADYFMGVGADESIVLPKNPTGKESEEDADVEATFEDLKIIIWVQAKQKTKQKTGNVTQEINSAINQIASYKCKHEKDRINKGYKVLTWVVTTASKKDVDETELDLREDVRLIYGEEFSSMLMEVGFRRTTV